MRHSACTLVVLTAVPGIWAQAVISAHSGMVNYVEGDVQLDGKPVKLDQAIHPNLKPGQVLSTYAGHAEILLAPEVFLRLGRNSSVRMIANELADTHVEVLSGSAVVEATELLKVIRITLKLGDSETVPVKTGLYHFSANT